MYIVHSLFSPPWRCISSHFFSFTAFPFWFFIRNSFSFHWFPFPICRSHRRRSPLLPDPWACKALSRGSPTRRARRRGSRSLRALLAACPAVRRSPQLPGPPSFLSHASEKFANSHDWRALPAPTWSSACARTRKIRNNKTINEKQKQIDRRTKRSTIMREYGRNRE